MSLVVDLPHSGIRLFFCVVHPDQYRSCRAILSLFMPYTPICVLYDPIHGARCGMAKWETIVCP